MAVWKMATSGSGHPICINLDQVQSIQQMGGNQTMLSFGGGEKQYIKETADELMMAKQLRVTQGARRKVTTPA